MQQLLYMIEYLLWKYGERALEDRDRVFDFMYRFIVPNDDFNVKTIQFLYDSGHASLLAKAKPEERKATLARTSQVLSQTFPENDDFTQNILMIFAAGLGYPIELLESQWETSLTTLPERLSRIGSEPDEEMEAIEEFFLGNYYQLLGHENEAIDHWTKAAEAGNTAAMRCLIIKFEPDEPMEKWYAKMLESGDEFGMYETGLIFYALQDYDRAVELLRESADMGFVAAMFLLTPMYEDIYHDSQGATEWIIKAADLGYFPALLTMGNRALKKGNHEEALEWYIKCVRVRPDHFDLMAVIAAIYIQEFKDYDEAEKWFIKAAQGGDPNALYHLAGFYIQNKKDYNKAKKYYLKAAAAGNADAMVKLGDLYENVFHDDEKAEKCYRKSIASGSLDGKKRYQKFLKRLEKTKEAQKKT